MSNRIEFFFDLSSPWTYLAFHNIQPILQRHATEISWRPFLVGGVHNQVNPAYPQSRANDATSPKWQQLYQSLLDWSASSGLPMNFPSQYFPLRSVDAMRFCCALEDRQTDLEQFMRAAFHAHYAEQKNLDDPAELTLIANACGIDGEQLRSLSQQQAIKDHLRSNTDEAIKRGAFGSPSIFVPLEGGERLYFGNDQLPLVDWALGNTNK